MMNNRILIVGQTPPPFGGQAMIIQDILNMPNTGTQLFHVRMSFSKEMSNIGKFEFSKLGHLIGVIAKVVYLKFRHNIPILYYPPSGPDRIPIYRDMAVLLCTRWLFKRTIFQFFAGGISDFLKVSNTVERFVFKLCFFYPDLTLRPSHHSPPDGEKLLSKMDQIVPWGNIDNFTESQMKDNKTPVVLFAGVLIDSKGIFILLDAVRQLALKKVELELNVLGDFGSEEIRQRILLYLQEHSLKDRVNLLGVKTGNKYYDCFRNADVFCFPSFFEAENLPVVIIDALKFELPVVATAWRGIPEMVIDGSNGYLVDIKNSVLVAERLDGLLRDATLRLEMGKKSREMYLRKFTDKVFTAMMRDAFKSVLKNI